MVSRTPLQRALAGPGHRKPEPIDAFRAARRCFLRGERVDVGRLAAELGVNRVTLYRWVGSRDQLLVEVIWSLTEASLREQWERARHRPGSRVPALLAGYLRSVLEQPGARAFVLEENERAMRLLTLASNGFQPRLVRAVAAYLEQDLADGRISTTLSVDELAYASVRIGESFHYLPTIAGAPPDPDGAERVLAALLRP
ncbi:QsdR family transcriptional regulator [Nocardia higoensis]|uniref:QsdR family transcriptional regulator n=1 Tax=Nocardia higoensis TaxID=228599 RepID=UPI0002EBF1AC|nr:QsdR family transcriptional regulator [Nocardia higoensis]